MPVFYAVQVEKEKLAGELRVNDIPLYNWSDGQKVTTGQPVNMWITGRSGTAAFIFDWEKAQPVEGARLQIQIFTGTNRRQPAREAREVARLDWRFDPQVPARPASVTLDFTCDEPPPSAFWPKAQKLVINEATTASVMALLRELNEALNKPDVPRTMELLRYKTADVGRSMFYDEATSMAGLRDFLEFSMEGPGWGMQPLEGESVVPVELHLVADGRLILARRQESSPVLRSLAGRHPQLQLPVYAAPVEGRWTVVR